MARNAQLLIEPFGIETLAVVAHGDVRCLLIEPFGIETATSRQSLRERSGLLIEPFGIETAVQRRVVAVLRPFNRTFWN